MRSAEPSIRATTCGDMSRPRAAQAAKNLTVNFNKKGELGTAINSLYLFANAGIQGGARIGQSVMPLMRQ